MSILIALGCLLGAFILGIVAAKASKVLNPGRAIVVGVIAGVVLAVAAGLLLGALAAGAALIGGIAGSAAYFTLQALAIGGC